MMRWIAVVLGAWSVTACGVFGPVEDGSWKPVVPERREGVPRVLFVGNSLSFGVPRLVAKGSAKTGGPWDVGRVAHGGWTLDRHALDPETLRTIRGGGWDVVVLQEQSRLPSVPWQRKARMLPAAGKLAKEVREAGAVPVFYQTWGYRDGDPARKDDDFKRMNARLREGYLEAGAAIGMAVVPVGDAWEREVVAGRGERLYHPDGIHPSPEGDALTAEVFVRRLRELRR